MQLVIVTDLMKWWNDDRKYFIFNDEGKNADMRNVKCQFIDMEIDKKMSTIKNPYNHSIHEYIIRDTVINTRLLLLTMAYCVWNI